MVLESRFGNSRGPGKVFWEFQWPRKLFWEFKWPVLWSSKIVLGIELAWECCFGNSSGSFCGPRNALLEFKLPWKGVLGIQVARSVVQERRVWNSSCIGKSFGEVKWPVLWSKKGAFGFLVALESRFGNSSGPLCGPRKKLLEFKWPWKVVLGIQVARFADQELVVVGVREGTGSGGVGGMGGCNDLPL